MSGKNPVPNEQAYEGVRAQAPPNVTVALTNPGSNQKRVRIGDIQINKSTNTVYILTSITAGAQLWSVTGLTNGNLVFPNAGNKIITPAASNTATAGSNAFGTVTLVSGTITVTTTAVTASSLIFISRMSVGSSTALGQLTVGTVTAGTSFVINAATQATPGTPLATDLSVVCWQIIN